MYSLENEELRFSVSEKGAELQNLYDKLQNREWLWQGDGRWWAKRAPLLFPFIGALKQGEYRHNGSRYVMTKHGFARDMIFDFVESSDSSLTFKLRNDDWTQKIYPFSFELLIRYVLQGSKLSVEHEVRNLGTDTMYFALGGHPAFQCPMDEESWELEFEKDEAFETYQIDLSTGLILNEKKSLPSEGKLLNLNSGLFEADALVFEGLNSQSVILRGPHEKGKLTFEFPDFKQFAVWSPQGPFVCLEPWFGMADFADFDGEISEKHGMEALSPGEVFQCAYHMTVG